MIPITGELIKRVVNGDIIVRGSPDDILKFRFEEAWVVVSNNRSSEELELEKSGMLLNLAQNIQLKDKLPYAVFIDNDWYILDSERV